MLGEFLDSLELVQGVFGKQAVVDAGNIGLEGLGEVEQFFGVALELDGIGAR